MSATVTRRRLLLATVLAATLAATWWASRSGVEGSDEAAAQPVAGSRRAPPPRTATLATEPAAPTDWQPVKRRVWADAPVAQFAAWAPPPPPAPPPAPRVEKVVAPPPPAPVAPPFPYQIIGSLSEGQQMQAFLASPTRSLNVRVGEVIDGQWRVDAVSASGLALTWLPAQIKQQIAFRATP